MLIGLLVSEFRYGSRIDGQSGGKSTLLKWPRRKNDMIRKPSIYEARVRPDFYQVVIAICQMMKMRTTTLAMPMDMATDLILIND